MMMLRVKMLPGDFCWGMLANISANPFLATGRNWVCKEEFDGGGGMGGKRRAKRAREQYRRKPYAANSSMDG
jgi:hypothetical protein